MRLTVQSSKNIIDADSDDENEMNEAAPVPTSSEMKNVMKSMRSYLDAHYNGEMNTKMDGERPEDGLRPSTNHTRGLSARRIIIMPAFREGPIHLQTFMPSPGLELKHNGTAVRVTLTTIPDKIFTVPNARLE
ncbi:hypothetical protein TNCV_4479061 [Trichonephila clavipes]|nr:hypothetical protein TNCV_4479061 [Trichonephila clavipes]